MGPCESTSYLPDRHGQHSRLRTVLTRNLREPQGDTPIRTKLSPIPRSQLLELLALPLGRLRVVRPLHAREELCGRALARGRPDDARAGLDDRVECGGEVRRRVRGVEVVEDGRDAVVERVEAACERADADLLGGERALDSPMRWGCR